jgi:diacylglycerol kinase
MSDAPPDADRSFPDRLNWPGAFAAAWSGIRYALKTQRSMRVHAVATVCVVAMGYWLDVPTVEWCLLAMAIGLVGTAELLNTAIEVVVNRLCPERNRDAGLAKDLAAGAVLVISAASAFVGVLIFGPRLWGLLFSPL